LAAVDVGVCLDGGVGQSGGCRRLCATAGQAGGWHRTAALESVQGRLTLFCPSRATAHTLSGLTVHSRQSLHLTTCPLLSTQAERGGVKRSKRTASSCSMEIL